jgi:DNA modification methylase
VEGGATMTVWQSEGATLYLGDCLNVLPTLPDASVDAVITDPPYPHIKRDYGTWTEAEWWALIVEGVIPEVRRILKPTGSAVFILQPNSRKVGNMRGWLWEFMAWVCREWNMVQDVWWWNIAALPVGGAITHGLTRGSLKACVWAGAHNCYRDQLQVLWTESEHNKIQRKSKLSRTAEIRVGPAGRSVNYAKVTAAAVKRGGVTPYNVIPIPNCGPRSTGAITGHGAGTPLELAKWWTRYIVPPEGVVLDPFSGVATMGLAALAYGNQYIGIEQVSKYHETSQRRIEEVLAQARQPRLKGMEQP